MFASVGADGSVRMFDLRHLEHSTIIYEDPAHTPLLRLAWNKQDPNYLATIAMDACEVIILDVRVPCTPVARLNNHRACVNGIAWAPHSSCHICTAGDDHQALIWDIQQMPRAIEDPILAYTAAEGENVLKKNGKIYSAKYGGWYCISDETFITESQLKEKIEPDGRKTIISGESGHPVEWIEELNYMFPLRSLQDDLKYWISRKENAVKPAKFQRILLDMVSDGPLPDISISRPSSRVHWGIQVPDDETQTVYVWLDALVNYLTAAGYSKENLSSFGQIWPPNVQVIGKDILNDSKVIRILNAELADTLGNLLSRCCGTALNPNQIFPEIERSTFRDVASMDVTKKLIEDVSTLPDICMGHYSNFNFYKAVDRLIATLHQANLFFETLKPWELKKQPSKWRELDSVLHLTLETLRVCGILLQPIIPNISSNLLNKINVPRERRHFSDAKQLSWDNSNFIGKELSGDKSVLFKRILLKDDEKKRVRS
ncbi:hypothetical protein GEV33_010930 [Tenebrio molitor]|uniref:Methionine--tRNA ligase, mitochondrial n=1 Tax=Tenebrio molitor TaxID=7067 RepID=A0A8J6HD35_TENMO|nr:hypothetical protein GEV33_010930 [Tenebrio molitor]